MLDGEPIIQVKGIVKDFPGVRALDNVSLDIRPGEVHVLMGENGAGKSTLAKILMGVITPDAGEIIYKGKSIQIRTPLEAQSYGIGGVHQEFMLVPWLNVAQNIFINREPKRWKGLPFIDHRRMHEESAKALAKFGISVDTRQPVKYLGTAVQQMIEICKVLTTGPKVLILDEPTAVLTEREVEKLFQYIKVLQSQGVAIIYISHRLAEIRRIGDRVTVLRDGKYVGTVPVREVTDDTLVQMMVGRNITQMYPRHRRASGPELLRVKGLCVKDGPQEVDLVVHEGEIVGLVGLVGAGRTELARAIFGIDRPVKGEITVKGKPVWPKSPQQMIRYGLGLLPEDRKRYGLALNMPVTKNVIMASLRRHFRFMIDSQKIEKLSNNYINELRIATPSAYRLVRYLSGGNQQKVVLAKWLDTESKLFIFDEPTRGIDVGAKVEVHALMDKLVQEGAGILMISSELPEVLGMSDRIYVMFRGRIIGHFRYDEADQEKIGALMLGIGVKEADAS
ncbi:MAG: sugar ABC transporter ATP-binding protein [Firmicutes bacterium]|nr:sugar ABC transporter ATP-binding protein [Bacillota bacterium]